MADFTRRQSIGLRVPASVAMAVDLVVQILVAGALFQAGGPAVYPPHHRCI
jgi:hypothetical protein